jgi:hypothetical protein
MVRNRRLSGLGARRTSPVVRSLISLGWIIVIGATFAFGYWFARYDAVKAFAGVDALRAEVAMLSEEIARGREERLRLERAHQMDREVKRQAQESLAELQRERLELVKRVSYLQRLVRDGQAGIVEVKEFRLREGPAPKHFRFEMLLRQLVPQNERTRGRVRIRVVLSRDGNQEDLPLDALPGSSPAEMVVDFEHFQAIAGDIVLPENADAERLVVEFEPEGASVARSSEAFLWPGGAGGACLPSPIVPSIDPVGPDEVE